MRNKLNRQKGYSSVELTLILSCFLILFLLAKFGMVVYGKLAQQESLMLTSELVDSMPLIFKDAMNKDRKVGSVSGDFWEDSKINRYVDIKIYREQKNVVWKMGLNKTGLIQKEEAGTIAVTMRGLYFLDCNNIQKKLTENKSVSNVQVNAGRVEYQKTCQKTRDNTIVYNQKI